MSSVKIRYPWDVSSLKWDWAVLAVTKRGFPVDVWKRPKADFVVNHITALVTQLLSQRNFVVCFCRFPNYMRDLYFYVAATWMCTTNTTADIVKAEDIRETTSRFDGDKRDTFEKTDLLIFPYTDPENISLKYIKDPLGSIFRARRVFKLATLIDLQLRTSDSTHKSNLSKLTNKISALYGDAVFGSFGSENSKYILVTPLFESLK